LQYQSWCCTYLFICKPSEHWTMAPSLLKRLPLDSSLTTKKVNLWSSQQLKNIVSSGHTSF